MSQPFHIEPLWRVLIHEFELSTESLTRRAGLPTDTFTSEPVMVQLDEWAALWYALEAETGDGDLAISFAELITFDMFDPAFFAAFCSQDLLEATARLQHYKRLMGPCRLLCAEDDAVLHVSCDVEGLPIPPRLWGIGELVVWVALVRHATRHDVIPVRVAMPTSPVDPDAYEAFFGTPVTHGSRYEITFDRADATRPFLTPSPTMWAFFEPELRRRLAQLDEDATLADRVGSSLLELLPSGRSQIGEVARALGMSARTLQRHLQREGRSYRELLDQTRERLAWHYLRKTDLTTTEIAFLLGYDDPNSLYPAFRAWTGMSPLAARATR